MIEAKFIATLETELGVPVYFGTAPQKQDDAPIDLPVIVLNRIATSWLSTLCGTDTTVCQATVQVDIYNSGAAAATALADQARAVLAQDVSVPSLENESVQFDEFSKAWRVMQQWRVSDYQPALTEATK
jgi:hypothetical protein